MSSVGSSNQGHVSHAHVLRRRGLWLWLSLPLGLCAGGAVAWQVPAEVESSSVATRATDARGGHAAAGRAHAHTAGMRGLLSVNVEPIGSIASGRGSEQLQYAVDIAPHGGGRAWVKFAYEIATPRGEVVAAASGGPAVTTPGGGRPHRATLETPARLADGYYQLRVGVAGSNGLGTDARTEKRYFQIEAGRISPLSFLDWSAHSGANRMHVIRSEFQPTTEQEARARFAAASVSNTVGEAEEVAP